MDLAAHARLERKRDDQVALRGSLGAVFAHVGGDYARHYGHAGAVIARPDFYVYGTVATLAELPALVDGLAARLRTPVAA